MKKLIEMFETTPTKRQVPLQEEKKQSTLSKTLPPLPKHLTMNKPTVSAEINLHEVQVKTVTCTHQQVEKHLSAKRALPPLPTHLTKSKVVGEVNNLVPEKQIHTTKNEVIPNSVSSTSINLMPEKPIRVSQVMTNDEWVLVGTKHKVKGIHSFPVFPGQSLFYITAIPVTEKSYQEDVKITLEPNGKIDQSGTFMYTSVEYPNSQVQIPEGWKTQTPRFIRVTHEFTNTMPTLKRKDKLSQSERQLVIHHEPLSEELRQLYTQRTDWLDFDHPVVNSFLHENNLWFNPHLENEVMFTKRALKTLHKFTSYFCGWNLAETSTFLTRGKGDCGQFSNALNTILRANNIPSRSAIGIAIRKPAEQLSGLDYRAMDIKYQLYHCMCQVYFKNLGWHLIEATVPNGVENNQGFEVFFTKHFDAIGSFEMDDTSFSPVPPVEQKFEFERSLTSLIDWNLEMKLFKSNTIPEQFNTTLNFLDYIYKKDLERCFSMLSKDLAQLFENGLSQFKQFLCHSNCPKEGDFVVRQDYIECNIGNGGFTLKIWCSSTEITGLLIEKKSSKISLSGYEKLDLKLLQVSHRRDMKHNFLEFQRKFAGGWNVEY